MTRKLDDAAKGFRRFARKEMKWADDMQKADGRERLGIEWLAGYVAAMFQVASYVPERKSKSKRA